MIVVHLFADFYFPIKLRTILSYIEDVVIEWEALGMALLPSYHHVTEINMDKYCVDSKRTELIRRWMNASNKSGPACWWILVKALEEKSVNMTVAAEKIRADNSNCELRVFPTFTINRFTNISVRIYYNTVRSQPSKLLDLQFGLTCLKHNHYTMQL